MSESNSPWKILWRRFAANRIALTGAAGIMLLLIPAIFAPLIANGRPLLLIDGNGTLSFPFLRFVFAPESSEVMVEKLFNYTMLLLPLLLILRLIKNIRLRRWSMAVCAVLLSIPFLIMEPVMDKQNYRESCAGAKSAIFAPIPYGPDEIAGEPYSLPEKKHIFGCDDVGRDLASRLIYGARVSLAVGVLATLLSMVIGLIVGMCAGYYRGKLDLILMRLVEILLCFPTFLLLLILMSMLGDYKIAESIPLVIGVIGLTGWIGLAFLVRGEVLKESSLAYVQSCVVSGVPGWKIMFKHLLPNISAPVLISFTFSISGVIMSESGLSFLGFGVQPPTASWGNLLRQAFDNPMIFTPDGSVGYWHLTVFPGLALFIAVLSFNFTGEGLRRAFDVKEG